jgi:hypothetical protein
LFGGPADTDAAAAAVPLAVSSGAEPAQPDAGQRLPKPDATAACRICAPQSREPPHSRG